MHTRTSPTALILTTYSLVDPKHGGQIRAKNLAEKFKQNGWQVATVAYIDEDSQEPKGSTDKIFPKASEFYNSFEGEHVLFINDLQVSKFVADREVFDEFKRAVSSKLDMIHVEQPWLWPLAAKYRDEVNNKCVLVYGSANIESDLKVNILSSLAGLSYSHFLERVRLEIDELERRASREADIVAAVSRSDLDVIASWGSCAKLVLAPNGVEHLKALDEDVQKWADRFGSRRFLLYAASAHPPNFTDFSTLVGGSLGCFPPDTKLAVVGSVTEHIYHQCTKGRFSSINLSRLELLFQVSNEDLAAIKTLSHGFFLPIPFGGGTNLKTAEALQSGKFVVGTNAAFRGFEKYMTLPGVHVASDSSELHRAVRNVMQSTHSPAREAGSLKELGWDACLETLFQAVEGAIKERRRGDLD